jgi:hypothetical protein
MIWVTHDLKPWDRGEPGGPVEMVRMLCFEFADGSGGSEWPVDSTWEPPASRLATEQGGEPAVAWPVALLAILTAAVLIGLSAVAFRRRG